MRKRVFLAILMIAAVVLTTSCSLIQKDAAVDASTVIIEVAGKSITKAEVQTAISNTLDYQEYMYSMYGMSFDRTDADTIASAQTSAIDSLVQSTVEQKKITELGMDVFTADELTALQTTADETYQGYLDSVKTNYFADTTLTGEELDKAIADKMTELGYPDQATVLDNQKTTKAQEKLKADVVKDVAVSDEEIQTEYDAKVSAAMSSYATTLTQYGTDLNNGATIYYRPAGYRNVKNILIKLADEDSTAISDLNTQITAKQSDLDTNTASLAALPTDATTDTAEQAKSREELMAAKATLDAALTDLNTQLSAASDKAYAAIQPTIDEIEAKLTAGADFDALMTEYGQDTGMQSEPAKTEGYAVCAGDTRWVTEFTTASMALGKVGDVSKPFHTSYGIHIVKYVSDVAEGAVALADLKDTIQADLLATKQDDLYNTTVAQWVTDANAKIYTNRLAD